MHCCTVVAPAMLDDTLTVQVQESVIFDCLGFLPSLLDDGTEMLLLALCGRK